MKEKETSQQEQMLRGTAWLTISNFISRLLGAIYIIPWYIWMQPHAAEANGLFTMGYNIYAWFLLVSTAGIPVAIAKQVAKYNAKEEREHSFILVREFINLMLILGLVFAIGMYLGSPLFAEMSGVGKDLIPVMRSLSWAVLVFPVMSVIRGFFQGFNDLKPFAVSQIAEQVVRVIWMLVTAYLIMNLGSKNYVEAVTQSTFAAFIGMIASMLVLLYFLWQADMLAAILKKSSKKEKIDSKALLWDTLREAIPFIITGSAIQLFQIIDQMTFIKFMQDLTDYSKSELVIMFSYFSANPNKITMILIAVATSIGGVGIPLLTANYIKGDRPAVVKLIQDNLSMLMAFLIPATVGSILLAKPLYTVFYGEADSLALGLFIFAVSQTLLLGGYMVLSPMIQSLFQNRKAVLYFVYGFLLKVALQAPMIFLFQAYGPLLSTTVGLLVPIVLMYRHIQRVTKLRSNIILRRSLLALMLTGMMAVAVYLAQFLLGFVFHSQGRLLNLIYLTLVGGIGVVTYFYLGLLTRLLDKFLGARAESLRQKLHIP
ncbi:putative polysaccharide biosynthesis protein [Streptococcus himalayensis]|uniref:Polysaccharide biosynthesis protein n=1 Tax=Streptococcus himalayensis TaxID=1888195 RepID=A0A917EEZ5_9STRE|nr:polysaccharide biosynthesis protein [Streptococcus himalayensis]GGE31136.1 polysaccharide biosynthesis protein [Streptococcus himalayensis]